MSNKYAKDIRKVIISIIIMIVIVAGAVNINLLFAPANNTAYALVNDNELIFQYLAPRSQTAYKQAYKVSRPVEGIKKEGKSLMAIGTRVAAFGAVATPFSTKIGAAVAATGGTLYLVGDYQVSSVKALKDGTKSVVKMDFKWTKTDYYPLKGTFRIKTYYTYKGTIVGKVNTTYQNRQFALGERW